jgi:hypothetical protein
MKETIGFDSLGRWLKKVGFDYAAVGADKEFYFIAR